MTRSWAILARGALVLDTLRPGDRVLVAEACAHHPMEDDIGTVKIPRLLEHHVGGALRITHVRGRDFPDDPSAFALVIQCGACMWTRRAMQSRIDQCREAGVPISNYGLVIASLLGILDRALAPFPAVSAQVAAVREPPRPRTVDAGVAP